MTLGEMVVIGYVVGVLITGLVVGYCHGRFEDEGPQPTHGIVAVAITVGLAWPAAVTFLILVLPIAVGSHFGERARAPRK